MKDQMPKFPPIRYITEGDEALPHKRCKCDSSMKRKWLFFRTDKCIQPNCDNYHKGFPSDDYRNDFAVYLKGELDMYFEPSERAYDPNDMLFVCESFPGVRLYSKFREKDENS